MKRILFILLALVVISQACTSDHVFQEFESIPKSSWKYTDTINFYPEIKDIHKKYDIYIAVRYDKSYEFSNMWLKVYGLGEQDFERIDVPLFKKDGSPYGKGLLSNYTVQAGYLKAYTFKKSGKNKVQFVQNMRKNPINGILDIGLIVKEDK